MVVFLVFLCLESADGEKLKYRAVGCIELTLWGVVGMVQAVARVSVRAPMRSRVEIMADMLSEVSLSPEGLRRTRIMYRCNLSSRQLKVYVELLREKGFLSVASLKSANGAGGNVAVYRITEEGLSFLRSYGDLKRRLREGFLTR